MKSTLIIIIAITLNLLGCNKQDVTLVPLNQVSYKGLHFPGTFDTAKKDGFNDCRPVNENSNNSYICELNGNVEFVGYTFKKASVYLDKKPNLYDENNNLNLESDWSKIPESKKKLTYKEISILFDGVQDEACLKNYPEAGKLYTREESRCRIGEFIATRLKKNGWLEKCDTGFLTDNCDYYKKDTNFYVNIYASFPSKKDSLSLVPLNQNLLTSNYNEIKNTNDLKNKSKKDEQDFINSMKK